MSLKSYLQALLGRFYSKTSEDNKLLSAQSAPDIVRRVSYATAGGHVAPCDGYIRISGAATMADGELFISDAVTDVRLLTLQSNNQGNWMQSVVPCKKGRTYYCAGTGNTANINGVDFIPFVGGGHSKALQSLFSWILGGALCQRLTHFSSLHSSSLARNPSRLRPQSRMQLLTGNGTRSYPPATVTGCLRRLLGIPEIWRSRTTTSVLTRNVQTRQLVLQRLFRSKKVEVSTIALQTLKAARQFKFDFSRLSAQSNLVREGGAL